MSARPPFDDLPREPLDADEAAIARIQRVLPAAEPPAELDARILAQARAAVARPARRARPWFMGAGFGVAATAVMAAGIAWQLGWIGSIPGSATRLPEAEAPADQRAAEAVERVDVEFIRGDPTPVPASPPPPPAPAPAAAQKQRAIQPQAAPAPSRPPPVPAAEPMPEAFAPPADSAPAAAARSEAPLADAAPKAAPQPFPAGVAAEREVLGAPAAPAEEAKRERDDATTSAPRRAAGAGRGGAAREALPPWVEDAKLEPDAWLGRIRERVRAGDRQGAEHSLRRFVLAHPQQRVPRDLQRLLVE